MMRYFITGLFLLFFSAFHAQTIHLTGKIKFNLVEDHVIFYTLKGDPFTASKSIEMSDEKVYSLTLTPEMFNGVEGKDLVFAADTLTDSQRKYLPRIHLGEMFSYMDEVKMDQWNAKNDISMYKGTMGGGGGNYSAEPDTLYGGNYLLVKNDSIFVELELATEHDHFTGIITNEPIIDFPKFVGDWYYSNYYNELIFQVKSYQNDRFGLIIYSSAEFSFKVDGSKGGLRFSGTRCTSSRNCITTRNWKLSKK